MIKQPSNSLHTSLSQSELDELDQFLLSDATSDEVMQLDTLDGYLTAIVSGPQMLLPSLWLPRVWGSGVRSEPAFETMEQAQHIFNLILRHMNDITASLEANPDAHEPILDRVVFEGNPREYIDGEMWAHGYMTGVALRRKDWQPLFDDESVVRMLRPICLLGADEVTKEEDALVETPEQREVFSGELAASAAAIYRYWLPLRQSAAVQAATPVERDQPKVGRNDPCPCGSGKKYKKCCAIVLH